jgi:hypothetical protein
MTEALSISIQPHNDIHFEADGNLAMARGHVAIGQHVRQRLKFWRGEWFLDTDAGVDWLNEVFNLRGDQAALADALVKAEIAGTPGVEKIESYSARYDRVSRGLKIDRIVLRVAGGSSITVQA